ncbi:hypothetical protein VTI28DRAFT_10155 [Corynascus sepedonium]
MKGESDEVVLFVLPAIGDPFHSSSLANIHPPPCKPSSLFPAISDLASQQGLCAFHRQGKRPSARRVGQSRGGCNLHEASAQRLAGKTDGMIGDEVVIDCQMRECRTHHCQTIDRKPACASQTQETSSLLNATNVSTPISCRQSGIATSLGGQPFPPCRNAQWHPSGEKAAFRCQLSKHFFPVGIIAIVTSAGG